MADPLRSPPGLRQTVFCHECQDEWFTSDRGLTCPNCGGQFVEIIEENNDPLDASTLEPPPFLRHHHDHDHFHVHDPFSHFESMRPERDGRGTLDYSNGLLSDSHFVRTRYYFGHGDRRSSASPYPRQQERQMPASERVPESVRILDNLMGRGFTGEPPRRSPFSRSPGGDEAADPSRNDDRDSAGPSHHGRNRPHAETIEFTMALGGGGEFPRFGRGRFVHNPHAGLGPRDANNAQPRLEPVDALSTILNTVFHPTGIPGHRGSPGPDDIPNAFTAMLASLFNPGVAGDAVYTQEALDRVITQLMEQHTGGNAPGPAPEDAIAALPKKKVDKSMLDNKDEGDCSVCMDTVRVGNEVTNLPCGHWFHEHCVSMWLREHNTCPICRKGITPSPEEAQQHQRSPRAESRPNDRSERPHTRSESEGSGAGLSDRFRHWFSGSS